MGVEEAWEVEDGTYSTSLTSDSLSISSRLGLTSRKTDDRKPVVSRAAGLFRDLGSGMSGRGKGTLDPGGIQG